MLKSLGLHLARLFLVGTSCLAMTQTVSAQSYPDRPVTFILSLGPGTGMDTMLRLYAERLSRRMGQAFIVENRPGASQTIAAQFVARAAPDGYTLLVATSGAMAINPSLFKQIRYDPQKDFLPIALYAKAPFILISNPQLPIYSARDFIVYANKVSKPLTYSSVGPGSPQHLAMEFVKQRFSVDMTHVPYRSSGQAITDTMGGHVDVGFADTGASLGAISDHKIRAIAVSSSVRLPVLSNVPPFGEAVDAPEFEAVSWHAIFAPAGTSETILDKLQVAIGEISEEPEVRATLENVGLIPLKIGSRQATGTYIKAEQEKWGRLVKDLGLEGAQ